MSFDREKNQTKIHRKQKWQVFYGVIMILFFIGILLTSIAVAISAITETSAIILIVIFLVLGIIFAIITLSIHDSIMKDIEIGHSENINELKKALRNFRS